MQMGSQPVAPRLVSWLILIFGLLEVPWVIYLMFNQQQTVQAFHLHLASLGVGTGTVVLAASSAWAIWRRKPVAIPLCVATATLTLFLGAMVTLSPSMQADGLVKSFVLPMSMAVPGAIAAIVAVALLFRGSSEDHRRVMMVIVVVLTIVALTFVVHTISHLIEPATTEWMQRTRAIVVILDTFESVGLIGAGIASLRGSPRAALVFASIAATLLICDAYTNVVGAPQGPALEAAIFYLIVGEIPSIVLSLIVASRAAKQVYPTLATPRIPTARAS